MSTRDSLFLAWLLTVTASYALGYAYAAFEAPATAEIPLCQVCNEVCIDTGGAP